MNTETGEVKHIPEKEKLKLLWDESVEMKIDVGCQWEDCYWSLDKKCIRSEITIVKIGRDCSCAWYITKQDAERRLAHKVD